MDRPEKLYCEGTLSVYPAMNRKMQKYVLGKMRKFTRGGYIIKDTVVFNGACRDNARLGLKDLIVSLSSSGFNVNGIVDYSGDRSGFFVVTNSVIEDIGNTRDMNIRLANTDDLVTELQRRGFYVKLGAISHPEISGGISDSGIVEEGGGKITKMPVQTPA